MTTYKWTNPHDFARDHLEGWDVALVLDILLPLIDSEDLQHALQDEMEEQDYFEPQE